MTGQITMYRPDRLFGFIKPDDGSKDIFFHWYGISEDCVGRRLVTVGCPVEFDLTFDSEGKKRANNIRSVWAEHDSVDPISFREESVITKWFDYKGSGLARRPDGGTLYVSSEAVITEGELYVGVNIWNGVRPPELDETFWHATEIEIIMPIAELPVEVPKVIEPVIPIQSALLDKFRQTPLRKLGIRPRHIS